MRRNLKNVSMLTSTTACKFAIDIHKISKIFGLLWLRDVATLNGRVQHQFHKLLIKLLLLRSGLAHKIGDGDMKGFGLMEGEGGFNVGNKFLCI